MSVNICVAPAPGKGRGLFVAKAIPSGSCIVTIPTPLVVIPDGAHISMTCSSCMVWRPIQSIPTAWYNPAPDQPLLQCGGCKIIKYCNRDCQTKDWKRVHKDECAVFRRTLPRTLSASVRMAIRVLLMFPSTFPPPLLALPSHMPSFFLSSRWSDILLMARGVSGFSQSTRPLKEVLELYCRILVNTFTYSTPTLDPIGLCIDPLASAVNHSCQPNTAIVFESGGGMQLRSISPIGSREEVTISYIDSTYPTAIRRRELADRYFFNCMCPRCTSGEDYHTLGVDISVGSPDVPANGSSVEDYIVAMKVWYARGYATHWQPLITLHQQIVIALLNQNQLLEALKHAAVIYEKVDKVFYNANHPLVVRDGFVVAMTMINLCTDVTEEISSKQEWARAVIKVWNEIMAGAVQSHGANSSFSRLVWKWGDDVIIPSSDHRTSSPLVERIADELVRKLMP